MSATPLGPAAPADRVRGAAGHVRAAVAVLLVAVAPLVPDVTRRDIAVFGLVVAFVWIPLALVVSRVARVRPGPAIDLAALVHDLGLVALVEVVLAPDPLVLLAGLLVLAALATYVGGRWLGVLAGVVGVAMVTVVAALSDRVDRDIDPFTVAVYPVLLGLLAWLLDVAATDRWRASAGLERLHEKSDAILTGVGEAVVVTDGGGRIEQWNRAAAATFGCPADEARGRRCHEVLGLLREVRTLDCSNGCALLDAGHDVEVWRRGPTGTRQPLLASASPVLDPHGRVVEVVHSYRDITRLKQADEAKTLFLATASHELKTPLTVIRGFAQMLLLPEAILGDDERRAALRAIDVRAGQLTSIVDRLLMSSRIEAGRIDLAPVAVDVRGILAERSDAVERATDREVVLELPEDLPHAWCDPDAVTTIVDHLLDNAVKYSPAGGPITVSASSSPSTVEIEVADDGIGMTPEQTEHCFERFWQAEATDVRRFGGTGIGLYIVRSLTDGMGGSVSVTSEAGAGSRFRVVLRRAGGDAGHGSRADHRRAGLPVAPGPS